MSDLLGKYECGVEYETNGEKPDLPDDVKLYINFMGDGMYMPSGKITMWGSVKSFRIVDERYKPKEQDMNNDWYGKGELPPEGIECEVYYQMRWFKCKTYININGHLVFIAECENAPLSSEDPKLFRPLKSETDKLQQDILDHWNDKGIDCPISEWDLANHLHDLGYRKIKDKL